METINNKYFDTNIINGNKYRSIYTSTKFQSETLALFKRAEDSYISYPNIFKKICIDLLIKRMKLTGMWQLQDRYFQFAYNDLTMNEFSRLDWKNPEKQVKGINLLSYSGNMSNNTMFVVGVERTKTIIPGISPSGNAAMQITDNSAYTVRTGTSNVDNVLNSNINILSICFKNIDCTTSMDFSVLLQGNQIYGQTFFNPVTFEVSNPLWNVEVLENGWCKLSLPITSSRSSLVRVGQNFSVTFGRYRGFWGGGINEIGKSWLIADMQMEAGTEVTDFKPNVGNVTVNQDYVDVIGGMIYTVNGWEGNGVNGYINTKYNPATMGVNYTLNNASRSMINYIISTGPSIPIDSILGGPIIDWMYAGTNVSARINSNTNYSGSPVNKSILGFKSIMRESNDTITFFIRNDKYIRNSTSLALPNGNRVLCRVGNEYGTIGFSNYMLGSALSESQVANFITSYNSFLQSINLNPIA